MKATPPQTPLRRRLSGDDGLSLIEMLVAIFILSVALFALLGGLIASARSLADQRSRSAATRVASEHLEELRAQGFDALRTTASPFTVTRTLDGRTYTIVTTLQEEDADPATAGGPTVMRITATVSWTVGTVAR
ncbi:MAG TPA: prepilin-type N-terminal cleavage/methylation domain-containing protein, partial [Egibacteraceae bacterium]|nr:prepilin-type N-terminal cleavage/methylation domain-containing protein [Egibacteraceae bacterium]